MTVLYPELVASRGEPSIHLARELPVEVWRSFVEEHPLGNVFHTPEMFQVFARTRGYRPELWAATDEGGRPLALMLPVDITVGPRLPTFLDGLTTRAVVFGSVLRAPGPLGDDALKALLRAYVRSVHNGALFTELRNLSDQTINQPSLQGCGFAYEAHLDYLVDLARPPEDVLQGIGQRTRKQIRRGLRKGDVEVTEASERKQIEVCYDLLRRTYATAQVPLADRSLFEAAFDVLYPRGMVKFLMAWVGDTCAAASVELVYGDTIYGWYGGTDRDYVAHVPTELLMWNILRWGAENGFRVYDFGGAGKPHEEYGVRDFKAKFGGTLVNYGRNICVHSQLRLMLSRSCYELARRFL